VVVPEDQLSLAIGRDGQNARLAAKLTGWRIDIKSLPEAAADVLFKMQNVPEYQAMSEIEAENTPKVEELLGKKAEGRPLSPEEYDFITKFIDRVEKRLLQRTPVEKKVDESLLKEIEAIVPQSAFTTNILDSGLPEHVAYILQEAGMVLTSDLATKMYTQPDDILRLQGIGPKAMTEITKLMEDLKLAREAELEAPTPAAEVVEPVAEATLVEGRLEEVENPAVESEVKLVEPGTEEIVEETTIPDASSLEEILKVKPEVFEEKNFKDAVVEEDPEKDADKAGKKGKKKGKYVEITYDPDRDVTVAKKKHKRDDPLGWIDDWDA